MIVRVDVVDPDEFQRVCGYFNVTCKVLKRESRQLGQIVCELSTTHDEELSLLGLLIASGYADPSSVEWVKEPDWKPGCSGPCDWDFYARVREAQRVAYGE